MTQETISMPEQLDNTVIHSPERLKQWEQQMNAYHEARREAEDAIRLAEDKARQQSSAPLTREQQYRNALEEEKKRKTRAAEREAEQQAEKEAEAAYLASDPDTAEVSERTEYVFLLKLQHWFAKGYLLDEGSIKSFLPGFYSVYLYKPERAKQ